MLLVRVRCGWRKGRCGQLLAKVAGGGAPGSGAWIYSAGASVKGGGRRVEGWVPADFTGEMLGLGCPKHGTWIEGDVGRAVLGAAGPFGGWAAARDKGLHGLEWGPEPFDFAALRDRMAEARRTGKTQTLMWVPWRVSG